MHTKGVANYEAIYSNQHTRHMRKIEWHMRHKDIDEKQCIVRSDIDK